MLFLNRRGYAPLTLCRHCGHRMQCPNCTAWLVEHRTRNQLLCHHCGHTIPIPPECPACGAKDSLTPVGPGDRAHHRGGGDSIPGGSAADHGERHDLRPARRGGGGACDRGRGRWT